jgi:signal transduction histidine kinase
MLTDQANGPIWGLEAAPWRIELQQPAAAALAGVARVRRWVFWTVLLGGLAAALAAVAATRVLTRRLGRLAEQAVAVRSGRQATLLAPKGRDEVSRIGSVLADLVQHLQREKSALTRLNAELDQRVSDRTARIERMADEARHAAVTRERLRLARDLHDTLAHSLMALLTQVRLVRKLRTRMGPAELDAELQRAETVAVQGLAEARAAITRMRDSGAADAGLVSALKDLVARFGERSGCEAKLQADAAEADLTGERAEVVHRIVGEALRNVERHAGARQVRVTVGPAEAPHAPGGAPAAAVDRLCVTVADDGQGFDPAAARPGHYGLIGMREQASLIGADLHIDARPGAGTRVSLCFAL